ncbi:NLR family CARD domain-containing protein 3-like [Engraulis encrasicolus]|uniref:NLR family CARD domain-containing protein 3-like n=1 Tax=Engraulis encrasicolus TaxID=184585 RepID=UPI002FD5062F
MRVRLDETRTTSAKTKTVQLSNIFSDHYITGEPVKNVLTLGIAGVGKTVAVKKFVLDWAEETQNKNMFLIFVLPFRELNMHTDKNYSLFDLLQKCHSNCEGLTTAFESKDKQILFVFDGLDEGRLDLFKSFISSPTEKAPVAVLISSLIKGDLLPSALIWVTSRPAAADKKLQDLFDLVTEIQGFSEDQREGYFHRAIPERAEEIISHLKSRRSLYIMCHIPVFCHITAVVMHNKYKERTKTEEDLLIKLGKLAFKYLEKDTLIFYEKDLRECHIDVKSGALQVGLCTQIFKEETAVCGRHMFSFVHLSVQEFLAALYMLHMHATSKTNLFITSFRQKVKWLHDNSRFNLYKCCLKKALLSQNGHLDLFVRFILGLAPLLEPKIKYPLNAILPDLSEDVKEMSITKTVDYIKRQISEDISLERTINLFHCLNELGDTSLVEEIKRYMSSSTEKNLTPVQCSTLAYLLLVSAEVLDEFDLKKYLRSEEGLHRMLPVICISQRVQLNQCQLSKASCGMLASTLQRSYSNMQELDMSDNYLQDIGVELLCKGLKVPQCKLAKLRLSSCLISAKGCTFLAVALTSNPFHLKELDLSYNHPGKSGLKLLSARLEDPHCKLELLKYLHTTFEWEMFMSKDACDVTLDPNTAFRHLSLSEGNREVTWVNKEQLFPDHPDRFDYYNQVLCREGLSGRCYWEVEWIWPDGAHIAVAYKSIKRKGKGDDVMMGRNAKSWSLYCSTAITAPSSRSNRVGVYLDWPAGTLSFYSVSSDKLTHLHTFHSTFTEPLYPGFWVGFRSSVSLCQIT